MLNIFVCFSSPFSPLSYLTDIVCLHLHMLGLREPLTEMNTRNLPGGKGRLACKAVNLTTICEPIV
jgi:hypothetical protein